MEPSVDSEATSAESHDRATSLRWLPMASRLVVRVPAVIGVLALVVLGILRLPGDDADAAALITPLQRPLLTGDLVEVWACHVPSDSTAPLYGGLPLRVPIDVDALAERLDRDVRSYFVEISHGLYTPGFVGGGEVRLTATEGYEGCVDKALAAASRSATVVLAVADAEHAPDLPGGYGSSGSGCSTEPCSASNTRRYAYVGASDFSSQWADDPPLDLVEHELGHTLGWVHSAVDVHGGYLSALDVMSNSAWPRAIDRERRDAPDTIGIQRLIAGWLRDEEVRVVDGSETVTLVPSNVRPLDLAADVLGVRLLVLPVDNLTFITVEVLAAAGFDDHLPADGVAVHRVRLAVDDPARVESVEPLSLDGSPPFDRLLASKGTLVASGWTITVAAWDAEGWVVSVAPPAN